MQAQDTTRNRSSIDKDVSTTLP